MPAPAIAAIWCVNKQMVDLSLPLQFYQISKSIIKKKVLFQTPKEMEPADQGPGSLLPEPGLP